MTILHIPANPYAYEVPVGQIIRIESLSNYCRVHSTQVPPFVVAKVLLWFEGKLPPELFARVHRGHLVNRNFIASRPQNTTLLLQNGELVPISRRRAGVVG